MNKKTLYFLGVLFVVGFSVYYFNLHNGLFWDDEDWILNNSTVHTLSWTNIKFWFTHNTLAGIGLKSNYYRPFLFFTFAINYIISGVKPFGFHLINNLLHIANAMLLFMVLKKLFKKEYLAFLVSFIFIIHPLQTEAVTYVAGRGDILVALFMLLGIWFFLKNHQVLPVKQARPGGWGLLTMISLVLALLSRETAIVFPVLLMVIYISFLSQSSFLKSLKNGLIKTWPYFAVVFVYGVLRLTLLNFLDTLNFYVVPNPYSEHLYIRFFTFLSTLLTYFKLLIIPTGLHMERGTDVFDSLFHWPVFLSFILVSFVILVVWLLYRKEKIYNPNFKSEARNPKYETNSNNQNSKFQTVSNFDILISDFKLWFFGVGWFVVTIAPVSGITPINALIYEHWLYLPMIGFWTIACFYVVKLSDFQSSTFLKIQGRTLVIGALVVYLSFFGYQAVKRNIIWGNPEAFYLDILKYEPDSGRINNNLGNLYFNRGDKNKAEIYYKKAVETADTFPQSHYNYGSVLDAKEDYFGAAQEYKRAIEIDPNFYYAYQGLVILYAKTGNISEAILYVEQLKKLIPENPRVYYNASLLYIAQNNKEKALENATEGLKYVQFDPESRPLLEDLIKTINNPPKKK